MKRQKVKIHDVKTLQFGTYVTFRCKDGHEYKGIVFGDKIGFEDGSYLEMRDIEDREVYLGW